MKKFFDDIVSPLPVLVENEKIKLNNTVSVSGTTYYEGWLFGATDAGILGTQTSVGAWDATNKAGTQYTVISSGLPAAEEVLIDFNSGRVLTSTSVTLYFYYYDYGRIFKHFDMQIKEVVIDNLCDSVEDNYVLYEETLINPLRIVACTIISETQTLAEMEFTIVNSTEGTGNAMIIPVNDTKISSVFATPLCFNKNDVLQIQVDTNSSGCFRPKIIFHVG